MRFRLFLLISIFSIVLQGAAPPAPAEKKGPSEQEFCRLDRNSDREITFEEFAACEFYRLEHIKALPYTDPQFVAPKDGRKLTDDELKAYLFDKADKNKNRKIDRKEWEEFYNSLQNPNSSSPSDLP